MSAFRIGDEVEWTSQSASYVKAKRGVIVQVVAAGSRPDREAFPSLYSGPGVGFGRNHESYVVRVKGRGLYWPRVKHLRAPEARAEGPTTAGRDLTVTEREDLK